MQEAQGEGILGLVQQLSKGRRETPTVSHSPLSWSRRPSFVIWLGGASLSPALPSEHEEGKDWAEVSTYLFWCRNLPRGLS